MAVYKSIKTFTHSNGLSAAFRQHKADSHCQFIHGYALEIRIEFSAKKLDDRNWVVDFGSMKKFKKNLEATFDHKLLVAEDDPHLDELAGLSGLGLADVLVVEHCGCEKFAELVCEFAQQWLREEGLAQRVWVSMVEVREHQGNAGQFLPEYEVH